MAIGSPGRAIPAGHRRVERRSRKRALRRAAVATGRVALWGAGFLTLGWLVAAGFYGLLRNP